MHSHRNPPSSSTIHVLDYYALECVAKYINVLDLLGILICGCKSFSGKLLSSITCVDLKLMRFWPGHRVYSFLQMCSNARSITVAMSEGSKLLYPLRSKSGRGLFNYCDIGQPPMHLLVTLDLKLRDCILLASDMQRLFPNLRNFSVECSGLGKWIKDIAVSASSKLPIYLENLKIKLIGDDYPELEIIAMGYIQPTSSNNFNNKDFQIDVKPLVRWLPASLETLKIEGLIINTADYEMRVKQSTPQPKSIAPAFQFKPVFNIGKRYSGFNVDKPLVWPPNLKSVTIDSVTSLPFVKTLPSSVHLLSIKVLPSAYSDDRMLRSEHLPIRLVTLVLKSVNLRNHTVTRPNTHSKDNPILIIDNKLPQTLQSLDVDFVHIKPETKPVANFADITESDIILDSFAYAFPKSITKLCGYFHSDSMSPTVTGNLLDYIVESLVDSDEHFRNNCVVQMMYLDSITYFRKDNFAATCHRALSITVCDVFSFNVIMPFTFTSLTLLGCVKCLSEDSWGAMPVTLRQLTLQSIFCLPFAGAAKRLPHSITDLYIDMSSDDLLSREYLSLGKYSNLGKYLPSSLKSVRFRCANHSDDIYVWISQMQFRIPYNSLIYDLNLRGRGNVAISEPFPVDLHPLQFIAPSCTFLDIMIASQCFKFNDGAVAKISSSSNTALSLLPPNLEALEISVPPFANAYLLMDPEDCAAIPHSLTSLRINVLKIATIDFPNRQLGEVLEFDFMKAIPQSIINLRIGTLSNSLSGQIPGPYAKDIRTKVAAYYSEPHWNSGLNSSNTVIPPSITPAPSSYLLSNTPLPSFAFSPPVRFNFNNNVKK